MIYSAWQTYLEISIDSSVVEFKECLYDAQWTSLMRAVIGKVAW
ncbi:hypothetical protein [Neorickettsia helminthoeca]|nr:hypothetical protein [Neorickettsia helminthoeca]